MALWAAEARALKERFGAEHVGLGTDSGGNLPRLADGWGGPADWPLLYRALEREGLSRSDLEAFFGGQPEPDLEKLPVLKAPAKDRLLHFFYKPVGNPKHSLTFQPI